MKPCDVCGNEIPERTARCPFCESPQRAQSPARRARGTGALPRTGSPGGSRGRGGPASPAAGVDHVNLKQGMPVVAEALRALDLQLAAHRTRGTRMLLVVHGYGSSGTGGAIRGAVRKQLRALLGRGQLKTVLAGEEYTEFDEVSRALRARHPALEATFRADRANPGITLVEL